MVWMVEILERGRWWPTVGASLTRADGRQDLREWRQNNRSDTFRLVKYARVTRRWKP